jgi:hypothetical protein
MNTFSFKNNMNSLNYSINEKNKNNNNNNVKEISGNLLGQIIE